MHEDTPAILRNRPVLRWLFRRLRTWRTRHRHPVNLLLHLAGIPLAVAGVLLLFFLPWYCGVGTLIAGYVLQYVGHRIEGNDVGEWAAVKRLLGRPYVAISPRWQAEVEEGA